jgi:hypothetical protein
MPETLTERLTEIERRLAALENTQDNVVHTIQTAGGQLRKIFEDPSLSQDQRLSKVNDVLKIMSGQFKSLKPRGRDN